MLTVISANPCITFVILSTTIVTLSTATLTSNISQNHAPLLFYKQRVNPTSGIPGINSFDAKVNIWANTKNLLQERVGIKHIAVGALFQALPFRSFQNSVNLLNSLNL